jgi:hypothetical protein
VRDLASLSAEDFFQCEGEQFETSSGGSDLRLILRLIQVEKLGNHAGSREAFSLFFEGPPSPALQQSIHRLENAGFGEIEIFLVPIGTSPNGLRYQALFT